MTIIYTNVVINNLWLQSTFNEGIMGMVNVKGKAPHRDFALRLKDSCDRNPSIPQFGQGQQTYIAGKLKQSVETIRRWFDGMTKPRPATMTKLAKLLGVDEIWLSVGKAPELLGEKAKKQYKAEAEGSAYLLFGMFMMHGHSCAFSADDNEQTDFFAIKGGRQQAIAVTTGYKKSDDVYTIPVRTSFEETINFAVIALPGNRYDVLYLDHNGIDKHAENKGVVLELTVHKNGKYTTGTHEWVLIENSDLM